MYATLIAKIAAILATVTEVKEVTASPKTKYDKFPAVFFQPAGFSNTFETRTENAKVYRFLMVVVIGTGGSTLGNVFETVLPATVDAIVAAFDAQWDSGTIAGHRSSVKIDSADPWEVVTEQDGIVCYAPLNVEIKVLTNT